MGYWGSKKYKFLRSSFFDGTNGALVVFNISRWHTYEELNNWISDLRKFAGKNVPFILIENKVDLIKDVFGEYDKESAKKFAKSENTYFVETSAKTGENVEGAFLNLTHKMIKNQKLE
jgi:small GTP-binding protein